MGERRGLERRPAQPARRQAAGGGLCPVQARGEGRGADGSFAPRGLERAWLWEAGGTFLRGGWRPRGPRQVRPGERGASADASAPAPSPHTASSETPFPRELPMRKYSPRADPSFTPREGRGTEDEPTSTATSGTHTNTRSPRVPHGPVWDAGEKGESVLRKLHLPSPSLLP